MKDIFGILYPKEGNRELNNNYITDKKERNTLMGKKLITESDVRRSMVKGDLNIEIDKQSILTPLAEDFIRAHHLIVNRV